MGVDYYYYCHSCDECVHHDNIAICRHCSDFIYDANYEQICRSCILEYLPNCCFENKILICKNCIIRGIKTKISFKKNIGQIIDEPLTDKQINDLYMAVKNMRKQLK
jgi:hypothetical protein